jgi:hypothetical protein
MCVCTLGQTDRPYTLCLPEPCAAVVPSLYASVFHPVAKRYASRKFNMVPHARTLCYNNPNLSHL